MVRIAASNRSARDLGLIPQLGRSLEEKTAPTLVLLPGEAHGQRSDGPQSTGVSKSRTGLNTHAHTLNSQS